MLLDTDFINYPKLSSGKVREIYDLGENLLIITTDRISAFDVILPNGIPDKGKVLTQVSKYWFSKTKEIIKNHLISTNVDDFPPEFKEHKDQLQDRCMLVVKTKPLPVECIVRGYISGSGWLEYQKQQSICGIKLPAGLSESEKLPDAIFTPSTKALDGLHDENITFEKTVELIGLELSNKIKDISIKLYNLAAEIALDAGIIIADTKFEFGIEPNSGELYLIDEALTPDSSRFWPKDDYKPGKSQKSFDKQFVRDYLNSLEWDKTPPGPIIPEDIVIKTKQKYQTIQEILLG